MSSFRTINDFIMGGKLKGQLSRRTNCIVEAIRRLQDAEHAAYALYQIRVIREQLDMAAMLIFNEEQKIDAAK